MKTSWLPFTFKLFVMQISFFAMQFHVSSQKYITVDTSDGSVKGTSVDMDKQIVWQFLGIPYAKPPIGNLRFDKPQPYGTWTGTLDATRYGPSCIQPLADNGKVLIPDSQMSEDCLFLNIYVPRNISKVNKMSVMLWIHGGGYQTGEGKLYRPNYLSLRGNVIVITINYRLNVFGFLSTGDSVSPGNFGLWDQRLAIQWVNANIEAFGGDPTMITIFGESAGGWSVGLQSLYPENKGLFKRAIMESGVGNSYLTMSLDCVTASKGLGNITRCPSSNPQSLIHCLRKIDPTNIMRAYNDYYRLTFNASVTHFALMFAPVIDNDFIKDDPKKLISDKTSQSYEFFRSLDVIIGNMNAEGSILLGGHMKDYENALSFNIKDGIPHTFVCNVIASSIAVDFFQGKSEVSKAICNKYGVVNKSDTIDQGRQAVDLYGDAFFISPAVQALELHSEGNTNTKTYQFMFTHNPSFWPLGLPSWFQGAGHSSEVPYLFDVQVFAPFDPFITSQDLKLSEEMLMYWSNFAKTGDPNSQSIPKWDEYGTQLFYEDLNYNITKKYNVFADRMKFWLQDLPNIAKF